MASYHILSHHMALYLITSSVWAPHPCLMALLSLPQLTIGIARCCSQVAQTAARCPRHSVPTVACRLAHRARCQRRSAVALVAIGWCSRRIAWYNYNKANYIKALPINVVQGGWGTSSLCYMVDGSPHHHDTEWMAHLITVTPCGWIVSSL